MSDADPIAAANERYLVAALKWLKLRLRQAAAGVYEPRPIEVPPRPEEPRGCAFFWWPRKHAAPAPVQALPPRPDSPDCPTDDEVAQAADEMKAALETEPPPAMAVLVREFGLDPAERDTLLLAASPELDTAIPALVAATQRGADAPTFRLAVDLFGYWNVVTPTAALRWFKLVEVYQPGGATITAATVRADDRVVNYLKGVNSLDDQVRTYVSELSAAGHGLLKTQLDVAEEVAAAVRAGGSAQLLGNDSVSKTLVAGRVAFGLGRSLYRLPAEALPTAAAALDDLTRLWNRESRLLRLALYLDAQESDAHTPAATAVGRFVERADGSPLLLAAREPSTLPIPPAISVDVARPNPEEQWGVWRHLLRRYYGLPNGPQAGQIVEANPIAAASEIDVAARRLAAQFNFNGPAMLRVFSVAPAKRAPLPELFDRLWSAAVAVTRPRLDALAQRLDTTVARRPVLPLPELDLLDQIVSQVRYRGRVLDDWQFRARLARGQGLTVLFAGESGTGKTMAAEWLARELKLSLYRVDPAQAFDKYIGETPKNFRRLFDAAEDGGVILFFDEADTYFGKRSEVRDSHDRYANLEINYLLQRMETFRGIAILATNMRRALDAAFLRRLNFVVNFPFPQTAQREAIWRQSFPPEGRTAPDGFAIAIADAGFKLLSCFRLTGGSIRNAALAAAFAAAAEEGKGHKAHAVEMRHAVAAAVLECKKFGIEVPPEIRAWLTKQPLASPATLPTTPNPTPKHPPALPVSVAGGGA